MPDDKPPSSPRTLSNYELSTSFTRGSLSERRPAYEGDYGISDDETFEMGDQTLASDQGRPVSLAIQADDDDDQQTMLHRSSSKSVVEATFVDEGPAAPFDREGAARSLAIIDSSEPMAQPGARMSALARRSFSAPLGAVEDVPPESDAMVVHPGESLFRQQAVKAALRGDRESAVLRAAPPWVSALFWLCASLLTCAVVGAAVGKVELTSRGRGVLWSQRGVQVLTAQSAGAVADVKAYSGDVVDPGAVIVTLDSATVKAALLEADRHIALTQDAIKNFDEQRTQSFDSRKKLLQNRAALLSQRMASGQGSIARLQKKLDRTRAMQAQSVASVADVEAAAEEVAQAERANISLAEEISRTKEQIANLSADVDAELFKLKSSLSEAKSKRDALAFSLNQTSITAPTGGRLESVLVHAGDRLEPGTPIGKLIPNDASTSVVSFVPERDRAFLSVGAQARIELDQLPATEFGVLNGHITRVGNDIVSPNELAEVLGEKPTGQGPMVRVEVELDHDTQSKNLAKYLKPRSMLSVRYKLRERRIITLFIEPLRRWFK